MTRLFVGGLPEDASRAELEKEFEHFGPLREVWVARNPPGFGFILFEDGRDAEDAMREMDGQRVCGARIRVEFSRGGTGRKKNVTCYACHKVGHSGNECRTFPQRGGGDRGYGGRDRGGASGGGRRRSRSSASDYCVSTASNTNHRHNYDKIISHNKLTDLRQLFICLLHSQ